MLPANPTGMGNFPPKQEYGRKSADFHPPLIQKPRRLGGDARLKLDIRSEALLHLHAGAGVFQHLFDFCHFVLADAFLHRLRRGFDQVLGFFQA